jgi:hypothetical protein
VRESAASAKPLLVYGLAQNRRIRNARPSRGQAASTRKRPKWKEDAKLPRSMV